MTTVLPGGRMLDRLRTFAEAHTPNALRVVLILILAWLLSRIFKSLIKTHPQDGVVVLRELRRRVKSAFDREGIEIPFPHLKLVRDAERVT